MIKSKPPLLTNKVAIVTGASSGIGHAGTALLVDGGISIARG